MNIQELSNNDLQFLRKNLESRMQIINNIYLEYDKVQSFANQSNTPLLFDFEKRKTELKKMFDELSPTLNSIIEEIEVRVSKLIGSEFSLENLARDYEIIEKLSNGLKANSKNLNT